MFDRGSSGMNIQIPENEHSIFQERNTIEWHGWRTNIVNISAYYNSLYLLEKILKNELKCGLKFSYIYLKMNHT